MILIINVSGKPLSALSKFKVDEGHHILSPFKGAKTLGAKTWTAIPYSYRTNDLLNKAFWIANFYIDKKINGYEKINQVLIYTPEGPKTIKVNDMRIPFIDHYFKDTVNYLEFRIAYKIWERIISGKPYEDLFKEIQHYDYNNKQFKKRLQRIYGSGLKGVINGGNEGVLYFKADNHEKIIKKSKTLKMMEEVLSGLSSENFNCEVKPAIEKITEFYNFDIELSKDENNVIEFEFKNILLPTGRITYPLLINSLIKQKTLNIMIDDNKLENYAKYYVEGTGISRVVFADFGISFVKVPTQSDFDRNFFGVIRDHYYLGKNYKHHNCRQIIKDRRVFKSISKITDRKFRLFHDVVMKGYEPENNACQLEKLPRTGIWKFCNEHKNTISKVWEKGTQRYLNLKNMKVDEIITCNCPRLLNEVSKKEKKPSFSLDETLSRIQDGWEVDFGPKVIALLTTTGKRDISKAVASIENQSTKVDEIIIASEELINSKYKTFINPYKNGLARNTMQALSRIKNENVGKVFVATLDDDDEWKVNYIQEASKEIKKGKTFISSSLEVREEGMYVDTWEFENKDMSVETFLYGNCGVQGSNKVFDLDIALESGGMPKNINASTDRAFNINMLMHPDTKVSALREELVVFNKDKRLDRITNNPKRLKELRNFYRHFWHLLDKTKVGAINKRHEELHGFEEVISWK